MSGPLSRLSSRPAVPQDAPRSVFGESREDARERRRRQGRMVDLLQSDLYERVADPEPETGMTWESPLGWRVRFQMVAGAMHVTVSTPDGSEHAHLVSADVDALDSVLP